MLACFDLIACGLFSARAMPISLMIRGTRSNQAHPMLPGLSNSPRAASVLVAWCHDKLTNPENVRRRLLRYIIYLSKNSAAEVGMFHGLAPE